MSIKVLEDNCTLKDLVEHFQESVSDLLPEELKQVGNSDTPEGILARIERCEASLKELENRPMDELAKAEMTRVNKVLNSPLNSWEQNIKDKCEQMLSQIDAWNPETKEGKHIKSVIRKNTQDVLDYNVYSTFNFPKTITAEIATNKILGEKRRLQSELVSLKNDYPLVVEREKKKKQHLLNELGKDIERLEIETSRNLSNQISSLNKKFNERYKEFIMTDGIIDEERFIAIPTKVLFVYLENYGYDKSDYKLAGQVNDWIVSNKAKAFRGCVTFFSVLKELLDKCNKGESIEIDQANFRKRRDNSPRLMEDVKFMSYINLRKSSNSSENTDAEYLKINTAVNNTIDLLQEQISLINPDVIIFGGEYAGDVGLSKLLQVPNELRPKFKQIKKVKVDLLKKDVTLCLLPHFSRSNYINWTKYIKEIVDLALNLTPYPTNSIL